MHIENAQLALERWGFHSYLQRNSIPFSGVFAASFNNRAFKHIKERAVAASVSLAEQRGEAPDMAGSNRRNSHLLAIAPNASSSIICGGTSPSIEPTRANVFTHKTLTGSYKVKINIWRNYLRRKVLTMNKRGKIFLLLKALLKNWINSRKKRRRYLRPHLNLTSDGSSNTHIKDKNTSAKRNQ